MLQTLPGAARGWVLPSEDRRAPSSPAEQDPPSPTAARRDAEATPEPPWWLTHERHRARVVDVRSDRAVSPAGPDRDTLRELLSRGMQWLTGTPSAKEAWRAALGGAQRIAIKFNSVGAAVIATTDALAQLLFDALLDAGYEPGQIMLIEAGEYAAQQLRAADPPRGWGEPLILDGREEPLAKYLLAADAVINIPFLKTHVIAGMSGCMKNISHAVVRHPARYHGNGCAPHVGLIVGSQPVSSRLRLNIVNALRVVVDRGPDATTDALVPYGGLLMGFDPVAVDSIGLGLLSLERRRRGLDQPLSVRYLSAAGEAGVGRWRPGTIDHVAMTLDEK
jgi:hypothetical protein